MRHREYQNIGEYCNGIAYAQVDVVGNNPPSTSYPTAYNTSCGSIQNGEIDDLAGPRLAVKPCEHSQVRMQPIGPRTLAFQSGNTTRTLSSQGYGDSLLWRLMGGHASPSMSSVNSASAFHGPDWFALIHQFREQIEKMSPRDFFLGEMLIEYKIFVDAFKLLINPTSGIKSLIQLGKRLRFDTNLGKINRLSRSVATGYLGYNFGVKPAVHDIKSTFFAHRKIARRISFLREHAGQWIPVRVQLVVPSSVTDPVWPIDPPVFMSLRKKIMEKKVVASVSALARVKRDFSQQDVWRAYSDYFGLRDVLQLGWELIPFSFVIDWFTNFQERIDNSLRPLRSGSPFCAIKDLCFTRKEILHERSFTSPLGWYSAFGMTSTLNEWTPTADYFSTSYQRTLQIPNTSGIVDLSVLGTFHAITAGALIMQLLGGKVGKP